MAASVQAGYKRVADLNTDIANAQYNLYRGADKPTGLLEKKVDFAALAETAATTGSLWKPEPHYLSKMLDVHANLWASGDDSVMVFDMDGKLGLEVCVRWVVSYT